MYIPEPKKQPSGNYFVRMRLGGVSYPITASSARECKHQAEVLKAQYRAGKRLETKAKENPTLRTLSEQYRASKSNTLSPSTLRGYKAIENARFKSVMEQPVTSVKSWQAVVNEEAKTCKPKTLANAWFYVASLLKFGGYPVPDVALPQVPRNERPYLDAEQIPVFINAVKGNECEIAALLALHSLRRSEIYGLTWDNVDLKKKRIFVSGSKVPDEERHYVLKDTNKNTSSQRYVPIMIDELYTALKSCKDKRGSVVTCCPDTLYRRINKVCEAADLPLVGVHGLRHSFASLAYHLNMPEKIAMQIGGWSDYNTMRKIYTHISQKDVDSYADEMRKYFRNANENANETLNASKNV